MLSFRHAAFAMLFFHAAILLIDAAAYAADDIDVAIVAAAAFDIAADACCLRCHFSFF